MIAAIHFSQKLAKVLATKSFKWKGKVKLKHQFVLFSFETNSIKYSSVPIIHCWPHVCWLRLFIEVLANNNKVSNVKSSSNMNLFCFLLKQKWNKISTNLPVCLWCIIDRVFVDCGHPFFTNVVVVCAKYQSFASGMG